MYMKKVIKKCILLLFFIVIFLTLFIIRSNPVWADFYSRYISSTYFHVIGTIFSIFPFSFYEFVIIGLVIYVIVFIISLSKKLIKKQWQNSLIKLLNFLLVIVIGVDWYFGAASVGYGRSPVDVPQYEGEVSLEQLEQISKYYIDDFNSLSDKMERDENGKIKMPYSFIDLNNKLCDEFNKLSDNSNYYSKYDVRVKKLTFSPIFTELHITGVTFAINGETSVNGQISPCELPFVMAHEISHSKGVNREDDANLVALYICLNSDDDFIRYSGYYNGILSFLDAYNTTFRKSYRDKYPLRDEIYREYNVLYNFWNSHDLLAKIGNFYNNIFLKINGNKNGTDDYNDSSDKVDTGEVDDDGRQIIIITDYSPYQKLFFSLYFDK